MDTQKSFIPIPRV